VSEVVDDLESAWPRDTDDVPSGPVSGEPTSAPTDRHAYLAWRCEALIASCDVTIRDLARVKSPDARAWRDRSIAHYRSVRAGLRWLVHLDSRRRTRDERPLDGDIAGAE